MYAIIQTGGKQYCVQEGDLIEVELLSSDQKSITFNEVLFLKGEELTRVGTPFLQDSFVEGEIIGEMKGPKVIAFKYKRRKGYRRKVGHRQRYTKVKITKILNQVSKGQDGA